MAVGRPRSSTSTARGSRLGGRSFRPKKKPRALPSLPREGASRGPRELARRRTPRRSAAGTRRGPVLDGQRVARRTPVGHRRHRPRSPPGLLAPRRHAGPVAGVDHPARPGRDRRQAPRRRPAVDARSRARVARLPGAASGPPRPQVRRGSRPPGLCQGERGHRHARQPPEDRLRPRAGAGAQLAGDERADRRGPAAPHLRAVPGVRRPPRDPAPLRVAATDQRRGARRPGRVLRPSPRAACGARRGYVAEREGVAGRALGAARRIAPRGAGLRGLHRRLRTDRPSGRARSKSSGCRGFRYWTSAGTICGGCSGSWTARRSR